MNDLDWTTNPFGVDDMTNDPDDHGGLATGDQLKFSSDGSGGLTVTHADPRCFWDSEPCKFVAGSSKSKVQGTLGESGQDFVITNALLTSGKRKLTAVVQPAPGNTDPRGGTWTAIEGG